MGVNPLCQSSERPADFAPGRGVHAGNKSRELLSGAQAKVISHAIQMSQVRIFAHAQSARLSALVRQACRAGLALCVSALAASCAISDEGAVSYRKAVSSETLLKAPNSGDPRMPLELVRQDLAKPSAAIRNGESITIRLRHAYISDCSAIPINPNRVLSNWAVFRPNCEEAVLVNAFEMTKGKPFPVGPAARDKARVIFFSTDVEGANRVLHYTGQDLNFDNMPIYGPITYNGGPLALDLYLIEIDAESPQIKALLGTIANLGSVVYPPASPALGVLNTVGGALLDGEQDDTDFRFSVVFDSYPDALLDSSSAAAINDGSQPVSFAPGHAWLEEGNYVIVRQENRQDKTPWSELVFDDNTGKIYKKVSDSQSSSGEEYRENTYLVVQILKDLPAKDIDQQQVLFSDFRSELKEGAEGEAQKITAAANALATNLTHTSNFDDARQALHAIDRYCERKDSGKTVDASHTLAAKQSIYDLVELLGPQKAQEGSNKPSFNLSDSQQKILLKRVRKLAKAEAAADQHLYTTAGLSSWNDQNKENIRNALAACGQQSRVP